MSLSKENKVMIDGQTYYGGLNQPNLKFIKINVDCWEKIFEFLSLRDILAMSQTCQRMRQIGGHYFRENFHGTAGELKGSSDLCISVDGIRMERNDFLRFIDTIEIQDESKNLDLLHTATSMDLLTSLTTLRLWRINLNENQLHGLEDMQTNIENIELIRCTIDDNSFGEFLALCPKLKSMRFYKVDFKSPEVRANLFQRTYPMLEHFEYIKSGDVDLLLQFLEQNPNVKCLQLMANDFFKIPLDTTTIKLDYLNIEICWDINAYDIASRFKALHETRFFKKLRFLSVKDDDFDDVMFTRQMITFSGLEALCILGSNANMCQLDQLKELQILWFGEEPNLDALAKNLVNLERLCITGYVEQLLPFICYAKKLKYVVFQNYTGDALDLHNLNEMRKSSGIKRKVQIGLYEKDYLSAKSMANNGDFDLVGVTREATIRKHFDI